jgi:hypothetical protein
LVLTTATRAAKTGVNVGEAICDFMMLRQNRPLPRTRFFAPHAHLYWYETQCVKM